MIQETQKASPTLRVAVPCWEWLGERGKQIGRLVLDCPHAKPQGLVQALSEGSCQLLACLGIKGTFVSGYSFLCLLEDSEPSFFFLTHWK